VRNAEETILRNRLRSMAAAVEGNVREHEVDDELPAYAEGQGFKVLEATEGRGDVKEGGSGTTSGMSAPTTREQGPQIRLHIPEVDNSAQSAVPASPIPKTPARFYGRSIDSPLQRNWGEEATLASVPVRPPDITITPNTPSTLSAVEGSRVHINAREEDADLLKNEDQRKK